MCELCFLESAVQYKHEEPAMKKNFGKVFYRGFAARVFSLRPNTCPPAADETKLPFAREKKPLVPRVRAANFICDSGDG